MHIPTLKTASFLWVNIGYPLIKEGEKREQPQGQGCGARGNKGDERSPNENFNF